MTHPATRRPRPFARRRAFQLSVGVLTIGLIAAACGGDDNGGATAGDGQSGTLRIAMFTANDAIDDPRVQSFNEEYPDIKIEFVPINGTDWEDYFSKILTEVAAGNPPDLINVATEGTQLFAGQGLAQPLDEFVQRDAEELEEYFADVHPALVEAMMYEGSLYQLPDDFNAANMYLNASLVEEAGLQMPAPDWDVDEFEHYAREIKGATGKYGYGWTNRLWGSWMPWIFVNDGNLFTEERAPGGEWLWDRFYADDPAAENRGGGWRWEQPTANSPEVVEALEFMMRLRDDDLTPAVEIGGGGLLEGLFASDELGMTPAGGFWAGGLAEAGLEPDDFDVQLFPAWQSQRHQFGTAGFAIAADTANPEAAWAWMKHTAKREVMELRPEFEGNVTTPVRRSMVTDERYASTGPSNSAIFYATLDDHPDTAPIPAPPVANPMTEAFVRWTQQAMNGEKTPQEAMDSLQLELEQIVADYGDQY
ncbi:ABC transporter substrate-binding protein [Phytoactinopolyspora mesophila]|uniref:Extracellular solute-binding protein n=1 Tax=Phytoactinopolyspora mesophila TaxID=2650750 RepID=A0A7K3MBB9_9ACTN|nr:sugar ABC transporter substrate-binding protein [Phytoactinopolyspora mesophila]NDL60594.1 extracellular solute-binding protein [Phytoactinopolyspora mesophila]